MVSASTANVVSAEVSAPPGVLVVPEEAAVVLLEGIAKGGYPVDINAQSTVDLTSIGQTELGCENSIIQSVIEFTNGNQSDVGYDGLVVPEPSSGEHNFPPSIGEVIRPMEMAELVDILPTLSLIEEEIPSDPTTPSVMDMLETFGLGIGESSPYFDLGNSDLINGTESLSHSEIHFDDSSSTVQSGLSMGERPCENTVLLGQDTCATDPVVNITATTTLAVSWDLPSGDKVTPVPNKGSCFPVRSQVEWVSSSHKPS